MCYECLHTCCIANFLMCMLLYMNLLNKFAESCRIDLSMILHTHCEMVQPGLTLLYI